MEPVVVVLVVLLGIIVVACSLLQPYLERRQRRYNILR
jgi:hypothetical protein